MEVCSYFYSSIVFFRAPTFILNEINKLQRRFLWATKEEERKINWVAWKRICSPMAYGGLGVRDVDDFNKALLSKWMLRFLTSRGSPYG